MALIGVYVNLRRKFHKNSDNPKTYLKLLKMRLKYRHKFDMSDDTDINMNKIIFENQEKMLLVEDFKTKTGLLADKYEVRSYLRNLGLEKYLIPLKSVVDSGEELKDLDLVKGDVIKVNHGSGENCIEIYDDETNLDELVIKFNEALKYDIHKVYQCWHYESINRRIIVEENISNDEELVDYKLYMLNGEIIFTDIVNVDVNNGRNNVHSYYDYEKNKLSGEEELPSKYDEMVEIAKKLFPQYLNFARLDFYQVGNKIYFGEITLTPTGNTRRYEDDVDAKYLNKRLKEIMSLSEKR